jgi:guanylate cyclase
MNDRQQRKTSINLKIAALSTIKGSPDDDMDLIGIQEDLNKHYWFRIAMKSSMKDTPPNEIIRRSAFILMSTLTCGAGLLWGAMYLILDQPNAARYPFAYSALMTTCFLTMTHEGRYEDIVFVQLLLILLLPLCLQLEVGGIVRAGGVIVWSFLCPLGAALFSCPIVAKRWFIVYIIALFITMSLEAQLLGTKWPIRDIPDLDGIEIMLFTMNITGSMLIIFFAALTFSSRLDSEYKRSEKLLFNVLPRSIAKRLKNGESHIIEHFESVTILFVDLVGFTAAASQFHPNVLIGKFLCDVFSAWDNLCDVRNMEKIKTIGDAFMAVGGIDEVERTAGEVATEMILLGLEMQKALDEVNHKYGMTFKIRIGIHSGPVIAGVIGVRKFAFDVWGDAVNTASRMESHSLPGYIHMSERTYNKTIKYLSHFDFICRGDIKIKGKGLMTTYLLEMPSLLSSYENAEVQLVIPAEMPKDMQAV